MHTIELFAFAISVFLGLHFCFLPGNDRRSSLLLGLLLIQMSTGYINVAEDHISIPSFLVELLSFVGSPYVFSIIILNYFFAISQSSKDVSRKYRWIIIPLVVSFLFQICVYALQGSSETVLVFLDKLDFVFVIIETSFVIGINILILSLIKRHNRALLSYFSSLEKKQLNWLKIIIIINLSFFLIWFIDDGLSYLLGENLVSMIISEISLYATLINVLWIGFSSLRQTPIFNKDEKNLDLEESPKKIVTSVSDADQTVFESIQKKINEGKHYLDSSLTLSELSDLLEVRDKELSRIINLCSDDSFYGFINKLRIEHFKFILIEQGHTHLSILGMAMESGFKNKSTFYAAFRKVEGMTPREYELALTK